MTPPRTWVRHGRHPAPARLDAESIQWRRETSATTRHLIDETCACRDERYDLWAFGGRRFIRKCMQRTGRVYFTDLMRCKDADETWQKILEGNAR